MGEEVALVWPARLGRDDEGRIRVRFPDFPEALTDGADEAEALAEAADCLAEAVAGRIADGEDIPAPSAVGRGLRAVPLEPGLACKAALYDVMRRGGVSKAELARRLGIDEKDARRLLDPRHRSKVDRLHAALTACGVAAHVTVVDTAGRRLLGAADGAPGSNKRPARAGTLRGVG